MIRRMLLAAALLAMPASVEAELLSKNFGVQCTPGEFRACAAVDIWNEVDPETNDFWLNLRLTHLQGSPGFEDLPTAGLGRWSLTNIEIAKCDAFEIDAGSWSACGNGSGVGAWGRLVDHSDENNPGGSLENFVLPPVDGLFTIGTNLFSNNAVILWGCSPPDLPSGQDAIVRCNEAATWRMNLGGGAELRITDKTELNLSWADEVDYAGPRAQCTTAAQGDLDRCVRVPEPMSGLLLITGLAGMVAVRRRRAIV